MGAPTMNGVTVLRKRRPHNAVFYYIKMLDAELGEDGMSDLEAGALKIEINRTARGGDRKLAAKL
jgi:hypothetical protein